MAQLTSFAAVQQVLNDFVQNNNIGVTGAKHGAFWNKLAYNDFINGNVPNEQDPDTGNPLPILNKINGKYDGPSSNLVMALAGTKGSVFDPNSGSIGQMPLGGPYMSPDQIQEISDWITAQCPE
jgi:hypothetical protein